MEPRRWIAGARLMAHREIPGGTALFNSLLKTNSVVWVLLAAARSMVCARLHRPDGISASPPLW